jgi:hypothetical protein
VLTAVAVFLLSLVALLAVPVTLEFEVSRRERLERNLRLRWIFGLVRVNVSSAEPKTAPRKHKPPKRKPKRAKRSTGGKGNVLRAIRDRRFRRRILRFARDLWRAFRKERLRLRLRIGLGDPADTGRLWAALGPVAGLAAVIREASIEIEPEFFDAVLEIDTSGSVTIVPLQLLLLSAGLMLSPSVWHGIKLMRT